MKTQVCALVFLMISFSVLKAENSDQKKRIFSKKEIVKLAESYVNNNAGVINPVMTDVDNDGDFDILDFTNKGNVIYYKNTGSLEKPFFVLENKHFDNYKVNSFISGGIPLPVFIADRDGDMDSDIFGIVKEDSKYKALYAENDFFDHYTLITIILVLVIILLVVLII